MLDFLVLLEIFLYDCDNVLLSGLIIEVAFKVLINLLWVLWALVLRGLTWNICHIVVLKGE